jgi:hypothetical protein
MYCTRYQVFFMHMIESLVFLHCFLFPRVFVQLHHRGPEKVVMVSGEILCLSLSLQAVIEEKYTEIPSQIGLFSCTSC